MFLRGLLLGAGGVVASPARVRGASPEAAMSMTRTVSRRQFGLPVDATCLRVRPRRVLPPQPVDGDVDGHSTTNDQVSAYAPQNNAATVPMRSRPQPTTESDPMIVLIGKALIQPGKRDEFLAMISDQPS